jgi:lysophospholipase L1-like esterase
MIYCIGDSFTYGEELNNREHDAWPSILGRMLNRPVTNWGKPATGNYRMVKRTMDAVFAEAELVIIGWSDPARQEFGDDISITDIWAGRNYKHMQTCSDHRIDLIKYMTAYDVPEYYYAKWLRQIILTQTFCRANNVPCIMFSACNAEKYNEKYINNHEHLVKHVDVSNYLDWPMRGLADWVFKTPHGPGGHPLEPGHQIIAEHINEHIRNIGWIS